MEQYGGKFPETYEKIRELKGIGNYTAGAIGSFVYDLQKPAVDGNVFRVVSRILEDADDILKASTRKKVESLLEEVIPKESPGDFNQGLIELGQSYVCREENRSVRSVRSVIYALHTGMDVNWSIR